jgi:UDP-N-acetylmuramyl pentapeptide phosphotransferase/UDP-N-acetylglucosamine-1-phosphate transferase
MSSQLGGIAAGLGAGFVAARLLWMLLRPMLSAAVFRRMNYRNHELSTAGGLVIVCAVLLVESVRIVLGALGVGERIAAGGLRLPVLFGVLGFAFLGLIDDLGASGSSRGFKGHVATVLRGRPSTGALKLFGGGFVGLLVASQFGSSFRGTAVGATFSAKASSVGWLLFNAALIALSANVGNLFDRAPGRTIKVSTVCFFSMMIGAVAAGNWLPLAPIAVVIGASLGLLIDDLREHMMLGDTGANVLGAVLAIGIVAGASTTIRVIVMALLIALNGAAELVSFSRVIERTAPLRAADRAGASHRK